MDIVGQMTPEALQVFTVAGRHHILCICFNSQRLKPELMYDIYQVNQHFNNKLPVKITDRVTQIDYFWKAIMWYVCKMEAL